MVKLSWYMLSDGKHGTRNSEIYVPYAMHCIDDYLQLNVTVSSLDENTHPSIHPSPAGEDTIPSREKTRLNVSHPPFIPLTCATSTHQRGTSMCIPRNHPFRLVAGPSLEMESCSLNRSSCSPNAGTRPTLKSFSTTRLLQGSLFSGRWGQAT